MRWLVCLLIISSCDLLGDNMAFKHKPFTQISIMDSAANTTLESTAVRNCYPPDVSTPSEWFVGGDGIRTPVRAATVFSCDLGDVDDIDSLLSTFTVTNGRSSENVYILALGSGRALQWYEAVPFEIRQGDRQYDTARIEVYSGKLAPAIYVDTDLIRYKVWGTLDGGTPDLPDGWSVDVVGTGTSAFNNTTFASGVATVSMDINTSPSNTDNLFLYTDIYTGKQTGVTYTFGITIDELPVGGNDDFVKIGIEEIDQAGVAGSTSLSADLTTTGAKTVSHTTQDADLYGIRVLVNWQYSSQDSDPETTKLSLPYLNYSL